MQRTSVSSSNLESVGYDETSKVLEISFKGSNGRGGGVYQYPDTDFTLYMGLMSAASKGRYFHSHIRSKPHVKVG